MHARPSLYKEVHKGIRSLLLDLTVRSGRVDWREPAAVAAFRADVQAAFDLLSSHAEHETAFVDPVLEAVAPDVARVLADAHQEQELQLHELLIAADSIDSASPDAPRKGHALIVRLSRVVGELITHMADEEEIAMTALWENLDDTAIYDVHQRLVASIPPDKMAKNLRWMLPAMNHGERVGMLSAMRANAPAPVFTFVRDLAASIISEEDNAALERGLTTAVEVQ